jgi:thioredoxin-like negative regulator of GroEL
LVLALAGCTRAPAAPAAAPVRFIEDDYPRALAEARSRKVPLFVDAWAPWCHTCLSMRAYVFPDPALRRFGGRLVWLALDTERESNAAVVETLGVRVLPTLYVVDAATEQRVLAWPGSLTAPELAAMLDGALRSAGPAASSGDAEAEFRLAQRAAADAHPDAAAGAYRAALRAAPAAWAERPAAIDGLVTALEEQKSPDCAREATAQAAAMPPGTALADVVRSGIRCATAAPLDAAAGADLAALASLGERIAGDAAQPILADDRSDLFEHVVSALAALDRASDRRRVALAWVSFLDGEALRAPSPTARVVFDSHRLAADLAIDAPERAVPMLQASARDFPRDYNPPARLGAAYLAMGKYDAAIASLRRALDLAYGPRKLRMWSTLADVCLKKGDREGAKRALREALAFASSATLGGGYAALRDAMAKRLADLDGG